MFRHASSLLAVLALAGSAAAQCLLPDGLTGPCWAPTQANLPAFPQEKLPGTAIHWVNCDPQPQDCIEVGISAPKETGCGAFQADLDVRSCAGDPLLGGVLTLDYTRTWSEQAPNGYLQVWRFVAKIDLQRTGMGAAGIVPPCLAQWPTAFYYGYVDYARDCDSGAFASSIVLFHNCDEFIHDPFLSSTPGVFHPGVTYALVAPSTTANPFVAGNAMAFQGPLISEAVRTIPVGGNFCLNEEPIAQGSLTALGEGCACVFGLTPKQVTARRLLGAGICNGAGGIPSRFLSLDLSPAFPWLDVITSSIGRWTTNASYPGQEVAWVDEGAFLYHDSCAAGPGNPANYAELHYGASTEHGFPVVPSEGGPAPVTRFVDLGSNDSLAVPGPLKLPLVGNVMPTRHLIYVNVPD